VVGADSRTKERVGSASMAGGNLTIRLTVRSDLSGSRGVSKNNLVGPQGLAQKSLLRVVKQIVRGESRSRGVCRGVVACSSALCFEASTRIRRTGDAGVADVDVSKKFAPGPEIVPNFSAIGRRSLSWKKNRYS
jgi:hypothetical protein